MTYLLIALYVLLGALYVGWGLKRVAETIGSVIAILIWPLLLVLGFIVGFIVAVVQVMRLRKQRRKLEESVTELMATALQGKVVETKKD